MQNKILFKYKKKHSLQNFHENFAQKECHTHTNVNEITVKNVAR